MPRKDGQPTAAERKDATRRESNRRYIMSGRDLSGFSADTLDTIASELVDDADVINAITAEFTRRAARARLPGGPHAEPGLAHGPADERHQGHQLAEVVAGASPLAQPGLRPQDAPAQGRSSSTPTRSSVTYHRTLVHCVGGS